MLFPKFNWYKSIHTTILWMFNFPIEIQIRTKEMDDVAEYGVVLIMHIANQMTEQSKPKTSRTSKKLQELVNAYKESEQKDQFKNKLDIELLSKETLLYTPKWDIIELQNEVLY